MKDPHFFLVHAQVQVNSTYDGLLALVLLSYIQIRQLNSHNWNACMRATNPALWKKQPDLHGIGILVSILQC